MKSLLSHRSMKLLIPACGVLGLLLRQLLMTTGLDDRGLLTPHHPAWIALLVLSAAVAAAIMLGIRFIRGSSAYRISFPASTLTALGYVLGAVGAFISWRNVEGFGVLPTVAMVLVIAAFLLAALCRKTGRKPNFLLHVVICVHFALQSLTLYRNWSFDPQLQDYCFQLFACIALTMTAYRLAMFDTGRGSHRRLWLWGLAAVYLCCVSMGSGLFYITGAIWALAALSHPRRRRRHQPEPISEPETPSDPALVSEPEPLPAAEQE